jgi:hypothetical protein
MACETRKRLFPDVVSIGIIMFFTFGAVNAGQWKQAAALLQDENSGQRIMVNVAKQSNDSIVLDYRIPAPNLRPISYQTSSFGPVVYCELGNARYFSAPGKPVIPYIQSNVIVPAGRTVASVRIVPTQSLTLPKGAVLAYGQTPTPAYLPAPLPTAKNLSVYGSDAPYPGKTAELFSMGFRCGVTVAIINCYPLSYQPKSGIITYSPEFSLEITLQPSPKVLTDVPARPERLLEGIVTEENTEALNTYASAKTAAGQTCTWLAITSPAIIGAATTPSLTDLVNLRMSQGFTCKTVSIDSIKQNVSGATPKEKLRNFIKEAYTNWNTKFVLLGGDTNIIPLYMVKCQMNQDSVDLPSDLPYQCLDQAVWNADYTGEVYIGRISAENATEFSNQVFKILSYETDTATDGYLLKGNAFGQKMDNSPTWGAVCMRDLVKVFPPPYSFDSLYDGPTVTTNGDSVIKRINSNKYAFWAHLGHGNITLGLNMSNNDEKKFTNTKFMFMKSGACLWGGFDQDCLAERVTTSTVTGFFAVVANSREGFYMADDMLGCSSYQIHKAFWQACFNQHLNYLGEFNEYSHRMYPGDRWDIVESNLLGDPAIKFRGKDAVAYVKVVAPNGGEKWAQKSTYGITWDHQQFSDSVKVELLRGAAAPTVLAAAAPNTGSYSWTIASTVAIGTNYKIRLTSTAAPAITDMSDTTFSVTASTAVSGSNLLTPAAFCLRRLTGSKIVFQVSAGDAFDKERVTIDLFTMQGKKVRTLANGLYPSGLYSIDIGGGTGSGVAAGSYLCKIKACQFEKAVRILAVK